MERENRARWERERERERREREGEKREKGGQVQICVVHIFACPYLPYTSALICSDSWPSLAHCSGIFLEANRKTDSAIEGY